MGRFDAPARAEIFLEGVPFFEVAALADARMVCNDPISSPTIMALPSGATANDEIFSPTMRDSAGSRKFASDQKLSLPSVAAVTIPD
jgi:hypothetical protein